MSKTKEISERLFYILECAVRAWDKYTLREYIKSGLYHKKGNLPNNFTDALSDTQFAVKARGYFMMTKQELLIEYNIQDIIEYIVEDLRIEYDKAMQIFYNSQTFDKLTDIETGLYLESSAYVYTIFQDELIFGRLVQTEI